MISPQIIFIIYIVFIAASGIQLLYYWGFFSRLAFYRKKDKTDKIKNTTPPVSVVICAKNEFENLKLNLPFILDQDYPDFEVVVVNDCSDDDTVYLLRLLSSEYSRLKVVTINNNVNFFSGKKFPLSMGIKSAKNEILLLTDADCKPKSRNWIKEMQSNFDEKTSIVLGYGGYEKQKGFLNKLIRYDTLRIAIEYMSFALAGMPYMGVGRNLSYKKQLFYKNKGFTSHYSIRSGDDDLFINKAANKNNSKIEISADSHTLSLPKENFLLWINQKKRHLTTGKYYKLKHKVLLGLYAFSQLLFYATLISLLIIQYKIYLILPIFVFRLLSQLIINKKCIDKFDEKKLLLFSPLFEMILMVINIYVSFTNLIFKSTKWK